MFTLKEIACEFGLKLNTLRYWLKKNSEDYESEFYDFNLRDLTQRIKIHKRTASVRNISRNYEQIIVLDIDEFKNEFDKYVNYIETFKKRRRLGSLSWTNSAVECYSCQMCCDKCFNKEICNSVISQNGIPPMKNTVLKLLETLGKPPIITKF